MCRKNVFLTHTEYHLLQSINIAVNLYNGKEYSNRVYLLKSSKRFKEVSIKDRMVRGNIEFVMIERGLHHDYIEDILNQKVDHFFFFQEDSIFNLILCDRLAKKGTAISLGPDGYKSYAVFKKKHEFLNMLYYTYLGYKAVLKAKVKFRRIILLWNSRHANNRIINNVWVTHPKYFHPYKPLRTLNIIQIPQLTKPVFALINDIFQFEFEYDREDALYFFNQPFSNKEMLDRELQFLRDTVAFFKGKKLYIKIHPSTPKATLRLYEELSNVVVIYSSVPAEIIVVHLKNCIVFSGWSSVLITENPSCNYYFNRPIYKNCNHKSIVKYEIIVLDHIKLIQRPQEMEFPDGRTT